MNIIKNIIALVAAFHLVFATSGIPLVYMFCGENFCSLQVAQTLDDVALPQEDDSSLNDEDSCCAMNEEESQCRTELHIVQLSVDAMHAAFHTSNVDISVQPLFAAFLSCINPLQPAQNNALNLFSLDKPSPTSLKKTILFRSLLI
jgi:hypothetical protein